VELSAAAADLQRDFATRGELGLGGDRQGAELGADLDMTGVVPAHHDTTQGGAGGKPYHLGRRVCDRAEHAVGRARLCGRAEE
jgi:hypothetical protein